MPLIYCEINLDLRWLTFCVITNSTGVGTFAIADIKIYVPVVTLSTQDNVNYYNNENRILKEKLSWNKRL